MENLTGLCHRAAQVGDGREGRNIRGQQRQQPGIVAQARRRNGRNLTAHFPQIAQQGKVLCGIAAPFKLGANRYTAHIRRSRCQVTPVQHFMFLPLIHPDRAFNHGDAGALGAGVHGKNRALDGHVAVSRSHLQGAPALFGSFDDDVAQFEMNGGAAPACGNENLRALVQFNF